MKKLIGILRGKKLPTYIIAEACDNHFGSLRNAKRMVKLAKQAGADAIKFQHHLPDQEMLKNVPRSSNFSSSLYSFLKKNALTIEQHYEIKKYCNKVKIDYLCTPFSYAAAKELKNRLKENIFKIGSGELRDILTLVQIAKNLRCHLILSTGMSKIEEIVQTVRALKKYPIKLALMNCTSEYPPRYEDINLKVISILKKKFKNIPIGHSDHTNDIFTSLAAVSLGAQLIEKHVYLDGLNHGPDRDVSISFSALKMLVQGIRKIEKALGQTKKIHFRERQIRKWAYRSIVTTQAIKNGETLTLKNIWTKRPGTGIPAEKIFSVLYKKAVKDLQPNAILKTNDFK